MGQIDHSRHQRAKQEVFSERDHLLKRADRKLKMADLMPIDGKDKARAILYALCLAGTAFLAYVIMICMWFLVYHNSFASTIGVFVALLALSAIFCIFSSAKVLGRDRSWLFWLGVLTAQAVIVGAVVGFILYFNSLVYYFRYQEMRSYTNVAASQQTQAFRDASMILWTEDTRLDAARSVGFMSRWTGDTYCAAPVVDAAMTGEQPIQFWAVGENCCDSRAEFHCGDSEDMTVRSALVILEPEDIVRPYMRWAVGAPIMPKYINALRMHQAAYFTTVSQTPKFVIWTRDPIALKNAYYSNARTSCIWVSVIYYFLLLGMSYAVGWVLVRREKRSASVIRK